MHLAGHKVDVGALIFGAILLLVGGYYLLVNTFGFELPELNWDMIWPIAVIALGLAVVARAVASRSDSDKA
jgi:TRAP-type C4-dicarboxylate transport system permease small subunit